MLHTNIIHTFRTVARITAIMTKGSRSAQIRNATRKGLWRFQDSNRPRNHDYTFCDNNFSHGCLNRVSNGKDKNSASRKKIHLDNNYSRREWHSSLNEWKDKNSKIRTQKTSEKFNIFFEAHNWSTFVTFLIFTRLWKAKDSNSPGKRKILTKPIWQECLQQILTHRNNNKYFEINLLVTKRKSARMLITQTSMCWINVSFAQLFSINILNTSPAIFIYLRDKIFMNTI